jgi:hypothetical protein
MPVSRTLSQADNSFMKNDVISAEFDENGRPLRRIRSFVRRQGRLTKGQQHALDNYWPVMGVEFSEQPVDFTRAVWSRRAGNAGDWFRYGVFTGCHGERAPGAELPRH